MLLLRAALPEDYPPLFALLDAHKDKFFDDYDQIDQAFLLNLIHSGELLVVDSYSYPVGVIWFSDRFHDLHAKIHVLINPGYWKPVLQEKIIIQVLQAGFESGLQKIKAEAIEFQSQAVKLLEKHCFRFVGRQNMETRKDGKLQDVCLYELKKSRFKKNFGEV